MAAAMAFAPGIGHNMPPVDVPAHQVEQRAVMPRRIVDENRRNQKLKQRRRRKTRVQILHTRTRFDRKTRKFGPGYRPGKLFKGHRI
jgi:hypothetical protein